MHAKGLAFLEVTYEYILEQFFSNTNIGKNPCSNQLNIERLESFLHVETSQISSGINISVTSKQ